MPHLCASLPESNRFLKFTSGETPADLLTASMAAESFFDPHTCTCVQALVELESEIRYVAQCVQTHY